MGRGRSEQPQQGVHGKGVVPLLLPESSGLDGAPPGHQPESPIDQSELDPKSMHWLHRMLVAEWGAQAPSRPARNSMHELHTFEL